MQLLASHGNDDEQSAPHIGSSHLSERRAGCDQQIKQSAPSCLPIHSHFTPQHLRKLGLPERSPFEAARSRRSSSPSTNSNRASLSASACLDRSACVVPADFDLNCARHSQ